MSADSLPQRHEDRDAQLRAANRRTGLGLLAISVVFFVGFFASRMIGGPEVSIAVIGVAVLLYLAVAIGRHLRR
ncbi:MAG: cytochrome oxidase small assembly protein [Casimicrobiaceae bacterium]